MRAIVAAIVILGPLAPVTQAAPMVPVTTAAPKPARCSPPVAKVVCENMLPGTPASTWGVSGSGDPSIQGFATEMSVDHGQTVHFKVKTPARKYHLDVYRLGYYSGAGARRIARVQPSAKLPQHQPPCRSEIADRVHLTDCGNWAESASWAIPPDATSGVYFARLVREDVRAASQVFFVVRDDQSRSTVLFQTSDATWQAYNDYGGFGTYTVPATAKASYNRPFTTKTASHGHAVESWVLYSEYPMIRWLESNGYDLSYFSSVDSDRFGARLRDHRVVLSVGHDEYWSAAQRANLTAARDAGVNLSFFSGNTGYWKTRWEPSIDDARTPYRTLVTYKESVSNAKVDPTPAWTGLWRDQRFSPPADGGQPENALSGTMYGTYDVPALPLRATADEGRLRFWRNSSLGELPAGSSLPLAQQVVGYEWDWDLDNGARPSGIVDLSSTPALPFAHHSTLYRARSGALVFSAASVQWSWGLDGHHDGSWDGTPTPPPDVRMQQASINILADSGAQPQTLQPGLVAAQPSADTTPPVSALDVTAPGETVPVGSIATISGTASDVGGAVANVEVSVDGGVSWHPASGRDRWIYSWVPTSLGRTTVEARAVDDSGNLGAATRTSGPTVVERNCPCSLWDPSATPATPDNRRAGAYEVGVRLRSEVSGYVLGVRFYKSSANSGTHIGNLWSSAGRHLARAMFKNETESGWQTVTFQEPVPVTAGEVYVASYHTSTGHFAEDPLYFDNWYASSTRGLDVPPLHALWSRESTNGVMSTGPSSYPTGSGIANQYLNNANFWVDVVFTSGQNARDRAVGSQRPTGTREDRNAATLAVEQSVEGTLPRTTHRRLVRLVAAIAVATVATAFGLLLAWARRRRRSVPAETERTRAGG